MNNSFIGCGVEYKQILNKYSQIALMGNDKYRQHESS